MQTQFGKYWTNLQYDTHHYIDFPDLNPKPLIIYSYETVYNLNEQYQNNKIEALETAVKELLEENTKLKELLIKSLLK